MNEGQLGWKTIALCTSVQLPCLCTARHCLCGSYYQPSDKQRAKFESQLFPLSCFPWYPSPLGAFARPGRAKGPGWKLSVGGWYMSQRKIWCKGGGYCRHFGSGLSLALVMLELIKVGTSLVLYLMLVLILMFWWMASKVIFGLCVEGGGRLSHSCWPGKWGQWRAVTNHLSLQRWTGSDGWTFCY